MNKFLGFLLFSLTFVQVSNAQFLWYENETNTAEITYESTSQGIFTTDVANPDITGINRNSIVSKFYKNVGESSNVSFNLTEKITSLDDFSINIKAYISLTTLELANPNTRIRIYLENSSVGGAIYKQAHFTVGQEWQSIAFDFDGEEMPEAVINADGFDVLKISFVNSNNSTAAATYYLDSMYGATEQVENTEQPSLAGSWGARLYVRSGETLDEYVADGYDYVAGAQEIISNYPSMGHVITNATNNAKSHYWSLRTNPNVAEILPESDGIIHEEIVPSLVNEQVIIDVIRVFKNAGKKVILYINGMKPSDRADPASAAAWDNYVETYFEDNQHEAWMNFCEGYIKRFEKLGVDGYWIDAFNSYPGNDEERGEFVDMIRSVDPNVLLTVNYDKDYFTDDDGNFIEVDTDGVDETIGVDPPEEPAEGVTDERDYKIIKYTATNPWSDFTAGHITPLGQGAPPNSWGYEEFTVPDMQASSTSLYNGSSRPTLKHMFLPMRETWSNERSPLMFNKEQAYRFAKKITDAGATVTFSTTTSAGGLPTSDEVDILVFVDEKLTNNEAVTPYVRPEGAYLVGENTVYHAADESVFLNLETESDITYTASVANPDIDGNAHTNVSSMVPSANNGSVDFILTHPFKPDGINKINFSFDYYTANNGDNNYGSGQYTVRLYNSFLTDQSGDRVDIIDSYNRIGDSWQTEKSVFQFALSANSEVLANGGYDRLKIIFNNYETAENFYIDNITFNTKDATSDLASGNSWLYNYSPDEFNADDDEIGNGTVITTQTNISTEANNSTTVLKVEKGTTKTSGVKFSTGDFDYMTSALTFRVYPVSSTITAGDPTVSVIIRKEGTTNSAVQKTTATRTLASDKWNEVTFTDLTSTSNPTDNLYDQVLLILNPGTIDSGATYYIDAVQNVTSILNWVGATDSDWTTANNWGNAIVPNDSYNVKIHKTTVSDGEISTFPTISTAVTVNKLSLTAPASLVFTGGGSLTTSDSGNITYQRTLTASKWHLMSSPVVDESYDDDWVAANGIASGTGNNRGISTFDNTELDADEDEDGDDTATGYWRYFQEGDESSVFSPAKGYGIIREAAGTVSFVGSKVYTEDKTIEISGTGSSKYSLVGNPFTGYLNLVKFFDSNPGDNLLDSNDIWVWNGDSYDVKNLTQDYEIAHGQAFFVKAKDGIENGSLRFPIGDVTHQGVDSFQRSSNAKTSVNISIVDENSNTRNAEIYFIDGTTEGFDNGYDGKLFGGLSHILALYSELVNNDNKKYQVQSLPTSLQESATISLGVIAEAGRTITFSAEMLNLPSSVYVYLEDRQENTFTLLNEANSKYEVTLDAALNGVGRFFLQTSSNVLSLDTLEGLDKISIYKMNNNTLKISGLSQGKATVKLFNLLGKQVLNSSFESNGSKEISLPFLAKGVYIVQLQTENGNMNKKIILE